MKNKSDYHLYSDGRFAISHYNQKKPFSNFLPGIAGFYGTPLWVFYVNRGQGVVSFGTKNKDNAILEFYPANKACQMVTSVGFRTFIKFVRGEKTFFYEPFKENFGVSAHSVQQEMQVSSHELLIRESNKAAGLETTVTYFTVPGEPVAMLAREVEIKNISSHPVELEILDGLPAVNPYGMNEFFIKNMSRTIEAWMVVENLEKRAPFLRLKVDAMDRPEVSLIEEGNFYFSLTGERGGQLLEPLVDPAKVFGSQLDFGFPKVFCEKTPFKVPHDQITQNRTPSALSFVSFKIAPGKSKNIRSFYGNARSIELLNRYVVRAKKPGYFEEKRFENKDLIEGVKSAAFTATASTAYDLYCGQTYLDNIMRGGVPARVGKKGRELLFYVYSRKHGDLERDYNGFLLDPTYFSQGDGNYRDVNQNRRNDVWFDPSVKDTNIMTFLNLIQLDGFNPLVIKPAVFHFKYSGESLKALGRHVSRKNLLFYREYLKKPFNPGELFRLLEDREGIKESKFKGLLADLSAFISREEKAEHGEGFWTDHWTYNLDLVESFLAIYPEERKDLIFSKKEFTFYDDDHKVLPRHRKYFLKKEGAVRQYKAVSRDKHKSALLAARDKDAHVVRTRFGRGEVYKTTLFVKLVCLFANKLASLDAQGTGIEMEAGKPSWCDALNGLPALFGSSLCETFELKRLALFLVQSIEDLERDLNEAVLLPAELYEFVKKLEKILLNYFDSAGLDRDFTFWDAASQAKEVFREKTFFGISGKERKMLLGEAKIFLEHARERIQMGLEKSFDEKNKLYPTYFRNEVQKYEILKTDRKDSVRVKRFRQEPLPYFLEGPVHALKVEKDPAKRRELLKAVRQSKLYDSKLGMYKVNAPLEGTTLEIGRAAVFTPGWLENESIWLHMEYKFLLEILKGGMTEEFFEDFKKTLVPFQPAERYGRSILENSSFIASSVFVDPSLHGTGFIARLSGSTAEFLSIWLMMNAGKRPFILGPDGKLSLRLEPSLPAFLFTKEDSVRTFVSREGKETTVKVSKDSVAFLFLGKTLVFYHNPSRRDTFGKNRACVRKISLTFLNGSHAEFKGDTVPSPYAGQVRDGLVPRIDIELG